MGLDIVNILLHTEEEFDIYLPDSDMVDLRTPEDLAKYIHKKLSEQRNELKNPQHGFYTLRKMLMEEFGFKREQLRPSTKLQELFKDDIRQNWERLSKLFSRPLPHLELNRKQSRGLFIFNLIVALISYYYFKSFWLSLYIFLILFIILGYRYTKLFGTQIPKEYETLSSLLRYIDYSKNLNRYKTYDEILKKVIEISAEELDLSIEEIKPNSRYVEDLGAD